MSTHGRASLYPKLKDLLGPHDIVRNGEIIHGPRVDVQHRYKPKTWHECHLMKTEDGDLTTHDMKVLRALTFALDFDPVCPPTLDELAKMVGLSGGTSVRYTLVQLNTHGYITWRFGGARSLRIVRRLQVCTPTCADCSSLLHGDCQAMVSCVKTSRCDSGGNGGNGGVFPRQGSAE